MLDKQNPNQDKPTLTNKDNNDLLGSPKKKVVKPKMQEVMELEDEDHESIEREQGHDSQDDDQIIDSSRKLI